MDQLWLYLLSLALTLLFLIIAAYSLYAAYQAIINTNFFNTDSKMQQAASYYSVAFWLAVTSIIFVVILYLMFVYDYLRNYQIAMLAVVLLAIFSIFLMTLLAANSLATSTNYSDGNSNIYSARSDETLAIITSLLAAVVVAGAAVWTWIVQSRKSTTTSQ